MKILYFVGWCQALQLDNELYKYAMGLKLSNITWINTAFFTFAYDKGNIEENGGEEKR